jgi:hypothetical protein
MAAPPLNPTSLALSDAAVVLSKASGQLVDEEALRQDIEDGAPVNIDGTLNLVLYAAWLVGEMARGD